ncbi:uncharacterized protein LOC6562580 isoform X3 [Drosophila grimshawi]|uniref:uncharacterized protein LOC6562580 isoform X3 n=1 Tax=Drosophila grimshawi TaxID=7222 RepID=UPI000C871510|nr:uncharacterized protein LOC6562580 isoform X3 [Drosophila grimshawi]
MSSQIKKCTGCQLLAHDFMEIILDDDKLTDFLIGHGVICAEKFCEICSKPCRLVKLKDNLVYRCRRTRIIAKNKKRKKAACDFMQSVRNNTYFSGSQLSIRDICLFMHYEMIEISPITEFLKQEFNCSTDTVINWRHYLREVFVEWAADLNCGKLGGPGRTVEIYELMVSKRKINRGKLKDGQWVLVAFERDAKKLYIKPIENKTKEDLLGILQDKIEDGTTVISSYSCLEDEDFRLIEVNHSICFVKGHTKQVDNISKYARKDLGYLASFVFKAHYPNYQDRFHNFLTKIAKLYETQQTEEQHEDKLIGLEIQFCQQQDSRRYSCDVQQGYS